MEMCRIPCKLKRLAYVLWKHLNRLCHRGLCHWDSLNKPHMDTDSSCITVSGHNRLRCRLLNAYRLPGFCDCDSNHPTLPKVWAGSWWDPLRAQGGWAGAVMHLPWVHVSEEGREARRPNSSPKSCQLVAWHRPPTYVWQFWFLYKINEVWRSS